MGLARGPLLRSRHDAADDPLYQERSCARCISFGDGAIDLVLVPGFISHLEVWWSEPAHVRWLNRLGQSARVNLFDKRGTGLSDRVDQQPDMDARMDDVRAVMDAVGVERPAPLPPEAGCRAP